MYTRWYLIQEVEVGRKFDEEKATDIRARLIAPLVKMFILSIGDYDDKKSALNLLPFFVRGKIISHESVQKVLGESFEWDLEMLLKGSNLYSSKRFKACERNLVNVDELARRVYNKFKGRVNLFSLPEEIRKYIPKEAYEKQVSDLKEKMASSNRFDASLFIEWMALRVGKDVPISSHGRTRNLALEVYCNQSQCPSGKDLMTLSCYSLKLSNEQNGFLVAGLLLRRQWKSANNLLITYKKKSPKPLREFLNGLQKYARLHKKIKLDAEGIKESTCYPHYNLIAELRKEHPEIFRDN